VKDSECVGFLQWALPRLGLRWRGFRKVRSQVCKRIERRMRALGIDEADAQRRIVARLAEQMTADGLLVVGRHETLPSDARFVPYAMGFGIYRRTALHRPVRESGEFLGRRGSSSPSSTRAIATMQEAASAA
jgi:hypothetical protein